MRVLLLTDVVGIGRADEIHEVSAGYARNFLLPRKLATLVTPAVLAHHEQLQASHRAGLAAEREEQNRIAKLLPDLRLVITARANDTGQLYGSVTADAVLTELKRAGITLAADVISIEKPLTHVGEHTVTVALRPDLHIPLILSITST